MEKIIIIPDSFKGTLSSVEVCNIMADSVKKCLSEAVVCLVPVADGGEGTVEAFLRATGGKRIETRVQGPKGEEIASFYGMLPDGTAVIEMAAAAGLPLMGEQLNVMGATTYGVGQLISQALDQEPRRIILGLGGSATNDGGCGAAAALGVSFFDNDGKEFIPVGENLCRITKIDISGLDKRLEKIPIVTMCDIVNPLYGPSGAACIFGPQKGASKEQVALLDEGLKNLASVIKHDLQLDVADIPGAGAAGGMGAGMTAFLGSTLQRGIEVVLETVKFQEMLHDASLIFTGEGKFDDQSLMGKVVSGVANRAKKAGVPVICVAGAADAEVADSESITAVFSINRKPLPYEEAILSSKDNLRITMENILRLWKAAGK